MSRLRSNCKVIWLIPYALVDTMLVSDGMRPNCRSSDAVRSEAVVSGLAPGSWVVTSMVGKSTWGKAETGSNQYPSAPVINAATPSSDVATGRRMNGPDTLIAWGPLSCEAPYRNRCSAYRDGCRCWRPPRGNLGRGPRAPLGLYDRWQVAQSQLLRRLPTRRHPSPPRDFRLAERQRRVAPTPCRRPARRTRKARWDRVGSRHSRP